MTRPSIRRSVTLAVLSLSVALLSALTPTWAAAASKTVVVRVVDGDTVIVKSGRTTETVRILGIDTPETKKPGVAVQCGGPEASKRTTRLLPVGSTVGVELDPSQPARDKYGRLLAHLRMSKGDLVAEVLLREGLAVRYRAAVTAYDSSFRLLEANAKQAMVGNWARCTGL